MGITNLRQTLQMAEKNNDVTVKCPREDCGYIWNYSGDMPKATCPACTYKCSVSECSIATSTDER